MHSMDPQGQGSDRVLVLRAAQRSVAYSDEFVNTVLFVRTARVCGVEWHVVQWHTSIPLQWSSQYVLLHRASHGSGHAALNGI
jgi:hypothetical protein